MWSPAWFQLKAYYRCNFSQHVNQSKTRGLSFSGRLYLATIYFGIPRLVGVGYFGWGYPRVVLRALTYERCNVDIMLVAFVLPVS